MWNYGKPFNILVVVAVIGVFLAFFVGKSFSNSAARKLAFRAGTAYGRAVEIIPPAITSDHCLEAQQLFDDVDYIGKEYLSPQENEKSLQEARELLKNNCGTE